MDAATDRQATTPASDVIRQLKLTGKDANSPNKNALMHGDATGRIDETERAGFEPAIQGNTPYNGLANRRLQPLGHLSLAVQAFFQQYA